MRVSRLRYRDIGVAVTKTRLYSSLGSSRRCSDLAYQSTPPSLSSARTQLHPRPSALPSNPSPNSTGLNPSFLPSPPLAPSPPALAFAPPLAHTTSPLKNTTTPPLPLADPVMRNNGCPLVGSASRRGRKSRLLAAHQSSTTSRKVVSCAGCGVDISGLAGADVVPFRREEVMVVGGGGGNSPIRSGPRSSAREMVSRPLVHSASRRGCAGSCSFHQRNHCRISS